MAIQRFQSAPEAPCGRVSSAVLGVVLASVAIGACGGGASTGVVFSPPPSPVGTAEFAYVSNGVGSDVSAYRIDATRGAITPVSGSPFAACLSPEGVAIDRSSRFAYVACHSGAISAYQIHPNTGALTQVPGSPFAVEVGAAAIAVDPTSKFVYVAVGGGVTAYAIQANGGLTIIAGSDFPAGNNPVAIAVDSLSRFVYVVNHVDNDVSAFSINPSSGALTTVPGSPFAAGLDPEAVVADPSGKFVYVANTSTFSYPGSSISAYSIDAQSGALAPIAGSPFATGAAPNRLAVDPSGRFLYAAHWDWWDVARHAFLISAYAINAANGALTEVAGSPFAAGGSNLNGVTVDSSGKFLYLTGATGNDVFAFSIDATTGALTQLPGSPFAGGNSPTGVAVAR